MIKSTNLALCSQDGELLSGGISDTLTVTPTPYVGSGCTIEFLTTGPYYPFNDYWIHHPGRNFKVGDKLIHKNFSAEVGSIVPNSNGAVASLINITGETIDPPSTNPAEDGATYWYVLPQVISFNKDAGGIGIAIYSDLPYYRLSAKITNPGTGYKPNQVMFFSNANVSPSPGAKNTITTTVKVSGIDSDGGVASVFPLNDTLNDPFDTTVIITDLSVATANCTLDVSTVGKTYTVSLRSPGSAQFYTNELLYVSGSDLGGSTPENDLIVQVKQAGLGKVKKVSSLKGTPFTSYFYDLTARNICHKIGSGARMDFLSRPANARRGDDNVSESAISFVNGNYIYNNYGNNFFATYAPLYSRYAYYERNGEDIFPSAYVYGWPVIRGGSGYSMGNILEIPAGTIDDAGKRLNSSIFISVGGCTIDGEIVSTSYTAGTGNISAVHNFTDLRPKIYRGHLNIVSQTPIPLITTNPSTYLYNSFDSPLDKSALSSFGDILLVSGYRLGGTSPDNDITCLQGVDPVFGLEYLQSSPYPSVSGVNAAVQRYDNGRTTGGNVTTATGTGLVVDVFASKITNTYGVRVSKGQGATFTFTLDTNDMRHGVSPTFTATINSIGRGYRVGDTITVLGGDIGGIDGENDLTATLSINDFTQDGRLQSATFTGNLSTDIPLSGGNGRGACVKVNNIGGTGCTLNFITGAVTATGNGYAIGNIIRADMTVGGNSTVSPTFHCEVMTTNSDGGVLEVGNFLGLNGPSAGSGETITASFPYSVWTNPTLDRGKGLKLNIATNGVATVVPDSGNGILGGGRYFCYNELIVVFGTDIGFNNNIYYRVTKVGNRTGHTVTELTLEPGQQYTSLQSPATNVNAYSAISVGCVLDLTWSGNSWNAGIYNPGCGYDTSDILTVDGYNGITITIDGVTDTVTDKGTIQFVTVNGTPPSTWEAGQTKQVRTTSNYGSGIGAGAKFKINGSTLGGADGINDVEFIVGTSQTDWVSGGEYGGDSQALLEYYTTGQQLHYEQQTAEPIRNTYYLQSYGASSTRLPPGNYPATYVDARGSRGRLNVNVCSNDFSLTKPGAKYVLGDVLTIYDALLGDNSQTRFVVTGIQTSKNIRIRLTTAAIEHTLEMQNSYQTHTTGGRISKAITYTLSELLYKNIVSLVQVSEPTSPNFTYNPFLLYKPLSSGTGSNCTILLSAGNATVINKGSKYNIATTLTINKESYSDVTTPVDLAFDCVTITPGTVPNTFTISNMDVNNDDNAQIAHVIPKSGTTIPSNPTRVFETHTNLFANSKKLSLNAGTGYNVGDKVVLNDIFIVNSSNPMTCDITNVTEGVISTVNSVSGTRYKAGVFKNIIPTMRPRGVCVLSASVGARRQEDPHRRRKPLIYYGTVGIVDGGEGYPANQSFQITFPGIQLSMPQQRGTDYANPDDLHLTATTDSGGTIISVTPIAGQMTTTAEEPIEQQVSLYQQNFQPDYEGDYQNARLLSDSRVYPPIISVAKTDAGSGFSFKLSTDDNGNYMAIAPGDIIAKGTNYRVGDMVTYFPIKSPNPINTKTNMPDSDSYSTRINGLSKLTMTVSAVDGSGGVMSVNNVQGIGWTNVKDFIVRPAALATLGDSEYIQTFTDSIGSDCVIDVDWTTSTPSITIVNGGTGYQEHDLLTVEGQTFGAPENAGTTNDLTFRVASVIRGQVVALSAARGIPVPDSLALITTGGNGNGLLELELVGSYPTPAIVFEGLNYNINDIITIPATNPNNGNSQWGGKSPFNDLKINVLELDSSLSGITFLGDVTGLPYGTYSEMKFKLPTPINDVVYVELVSNYNILTTCMVQIDELIDKGFTTDRKSYWRSVIPNQINSAPDRLGVKFFYPNSYDSFNVRLLDFTGAPIKQLKNWMLELVLYSEV